jgi:hypothetical protein
LVDDVDAAFDAAGASFEVFVAEGVGEAFDGVAGRDRVAVEVQVAMEFDEGHGALVAGEDRERGGAQVFALEWLGSGCDGWYRGWAAAVGDAEAVDDVFGIDVRPHDDAHLGEAGADLGEFCGEGALRGVEFGGAIEQRGAFGVERGECVWSVGDAPVAGGIADCGHDDSPSEN